MSGIFKAGQLSAIMGVSGAGKSTLLNILACRTQITVDGGVVSANGMSYSYDTFGTFASYVTQQDVLMESLTVGETLHFAANLKYNMKSE